MMLPVETSRPVLVVETDPQLVASGVTTLSTRASPSVLPAPPTNAQLVTRTTSEMLLDVALNVNSSTVAPEEDTVDVKILANVMPNTGLLIVHA